MNDLNDICCPMCSQIMKNTGEPVKKASSYEDCIRKCFDCKIGYSNSKVNPTLIYMNPTQNIPDFVESKKFMALLENSLNIRNRENKILKATFSTSEDALTYTFFEYILENDLVENILKIIYDKIKLKESRIYLWGCSLEKPSEEDEFIQIIKYILKYEYSESTQSYTEPDVIIEIPDFGIIIIEVKYRSPNEIKETDKIKKYLENEYYTDKDMAIESKHYELIRNWSLGNSISGERNFILVNLGKKELFENKDIKLLNKFENSLNQNERKRFIKISWEHLIKNISDEYQSFKFYLSKKIEAR